MDRSDAEVAAAVLVRTETRGIRTHGVRYLPIYADLITRGCVNPRAAPHVVRESATTAVVDGDDGLGHVVAHRATAIAIAKAKASGLGLVLVNNSSHFGAAGHYALMCAEAGVGGLAFSNGEPTISPPGSGRAVIGNSPTAYGFPDPDGEGAVVFDAAFSRTSGSAVYMAAERGERIAEGFLVDTAGSPTTDPTAYVERRASLVPIASHKGLGLALLGEILAGVLSGAEFASSLPRWGTGPERAGHAFLAFSIDTAMTPSHFAKRLSRLRRDLHDAGGRLPGERAAQSEREAFTHGVELDSVTWHDLNCLADGLGLGPELAASVL